MLIFKEQYLPCFPDISYYPLFSDFCMKKFELTVKMKILETFFFIKLVAYIRKTG
jgi:hypothetical protein